MVDERNPNNADEWQQDLNPGFAAGQNTPAGQETIDYRLASDVKELHEALPEFSNDELREISVVPAGARLLQGATYLDIAAANRHEFRATGDHEAEPGHYYVPKSITDYQTWNRLRGIRDEARTGLRAS